MKVVTLKDAEKVPINLDARKMCIRDDVELIHLEFAPGQGLDVHANPFDVVFYVVEGTGELTVGDEKMTAAEDTAIEVPAGVMRGWQNAGAGRLRVLVVKSLKK